MTIPPGKHKKTVLQTLLLDPENIFIFCLKGMPNKMKQKRYAVHIDIMPKTISGIPSAKTLTLLVLHIIKPPGNIHNKECCVFNVRRVCLVL